MQLLATTQDFIVGVLAFCITKHRPDDAQRKHRAHHVESELAAIKAELSRAASRTVIALDQQPQSGPTPVARRSAERKSHLLGELAVLRLPTAGPLRAFQSPPPGAGEQPPSIRSSLRNQCRNDTTKSPSPRRESSQGSRGATTLVRSAVPGTRLVDLEDRCRSSSSAAVLKPGRREASLPAGTDDELADALLRAFS